MKILYLTNGENCDYQADMLFHGLVTLGMEVFDIEPMWFMYQGIDRSKLYGKGFSLYGLLPKIPEISISETLIAEKFFDLVIYGSCHRCLDRWELVSKVYPPEKIVFIDGEDNMQLRQELIGRGHYFKRELYYVLEAPGGLPGLHPIQFAIPEEKLQPRSPKQREMALLTPFDIKTYIYDSEQAYYDGYSESRFAVTVKKAGWDCMRHYEIMACNCIPWFRNLDWCPPRIMENLPKRELIAVAKLLESGIKIPDSLWEEVNEHCQAALRNRLTTTALAKYVLERVL